MRSSARSATAAAVSLASVIVAVVLLSPEAEAEKPQEHDHHGGCPSGMQRVEAFCIDRFEAPNRRGAC